MTKDSKARIFDSDTFVWNMQDDGLPPGNIKVVKEGEQEMIVFEPGKECEVLPPELAKRRKNEK